MENDGITPLHWKFCNVIWIEPGDRVYLSGAEVYWHFVSALKMSCE